MSKNTVLTLVGSLRADSTNRKLAEAIQLNAPEQVDVVIHESLGNIPFYNEDIDVEGQVPAAAAALRAAANDADALLLVTPEHNGTVPGLAEERHRLAVPPVRRRRPCRQAHRRRRHRLRPVRRRLGPGRGPQGGRHRRRPGPRGRQARRSRVPWSASPRCTRRTTPRLWSRSRASSTLWPKFARPKRPRHGALRTQQYAARPGSRCCRASPFRSIASVKQSFPLRQHG